MDISMLSFSAFICVLTVHTFIYFWLVFYAVKLASRNPKLLNQDNLNIISWKRQIVLIIAVIFGTMFGYLFMIDSKTKKEISDNRIIPKAFSIVFLVISILLPIIDFIALPNYMDRYYHINDDGIIRPAHQMLILGYETPSQFLIHKAIKDFFSGIVISVYAYNFMPSDSKWYVKIRKVLGYILLYSLVLSITDVHYFDKYELLPRLILGIVCYFLIKDYKVGNKENNVRVNTNEIKISESIIEEESSPKNSNTDVVDGANKISLNSLNMEKENDVEMHKEVEELTKSDIKEKLYCQYCGKSIDAKSLYCQYCGKKVAQSNTSKFSTYHLLSRIYNNILAGLMVIFVFIKRGFLFVGRIIKKTLLYVYSLLNYYFKFIVRIWRYLVVGLSLIIAIFICYLGYDYYTNEYIPKKKINNAIVDITHKFYTSKDSIKCDYAMKILSMETEWGYEGVNDWYIYNRSEDLRSEALNFIKSQAENGCARCQYGLGQLYFFHKAYGFEKDETKAAYWWNEAAQNGYTKAYNNIGMAYKDGIGVKQDLRKAVEWLKKGAETGYDYAQKNYGDMFRNGVKIKIGTHKETRSTTNYIYGDNVIRVVWDGRIDSHRYYYLEEVDDSLTLVPKDIEKAKYWWKKAAEQGHSGAKENLEKIYN